jgi:hypothetical protein
MQMQYVKDTVLGWKSGTLTVSGLRVAAPSFRLGGGVGAWQGSVASRSVCCCLLRAFADSLRPVWFLQPKV